VKSRGRPFPTEAFPAGGFSTADAFRAPDRKSRARRVSPAYRVVAVPAAIALGSVGGIAAERSHLPWIVGALAGVVAAVLGVLALPSIPTRRATVVLLGLGGLIALRHASYAGIDHSWLLVVWAAGTMLTLVLVDRADAELAPALDGGTPLPNRLRETARVGAVIGLVVVIAAVALVPTVTNRLGRHVWPGLQPTLGDRADASSSLLSGDQLSLTSRPRLSDAVVFTVDADHADFWRGETFNAYSSDGGTWTNSLGPDPVPDESVTRDGTRVDIAPEVFNRSARDGNEFRQTFHVEATYSNVIFAAPSARVVETDKQVIRRPDGTLQVAGADVYRGLDGSDSGFGKGAVYTVTSRSLPVTEGALRAPPTVPTPTAITQSYLTVCCGTTPRVRRLATQIAAGSTNTYDKVRGFESWLGAHTQYSLNAPLSPSGVDVVDDFLFNKRVGWCEQIASSLVMMARAAAIPARLVTGFVPGTRDALTGRFRVRERDAHAWAEIYFPGIGWQGFDPTASVPLAGNAHAGGSWLSDARRNAVPLAITIAFVILLAAAAPEIVAVLRRRRARRASWSASALHRLERAGRKAGRARAPAETPREYALALAERLGDDRLARVGDTLDADLYSAHGAPDADRADADSVLTSL
jgi:transglutaminase-like putative cysteine protease